jgi:putative ABC transport system permease protein
MNPAATLALLWRRFTLRHATDAPGTTSLLILILALGVAVYVSIRLANRAASSSFHHFTDLVAAENDWILQAPAGDLPESILPELLQRLGPDPVHLIPIVESTATQPPTPPPSPTNPTSTTSTTPATDTIESIGSRPTFHILGIDLVGIQNLAPTPDPDPTHPPNAFLFDPDPHTNPAAAGADASDRFWSALRDPASVFLGEATARRHNLRRGDSWPLILNDRIVPLRVAGIIPDLPGRPAAPPSFLVMDLPALQHWTGRTGVLSRIELRVEDGPDRDRRRASLRERLQRWASLPPPDLPSAQPPTQPRWRVIAPSDRRDAGAMMTRAFRLNLTILSLLALLVGLYLMVQALDGAVVRRRAEIGTLRSLGIPPATLQRAWLLEAAALGTIGGILGVLLGWAGAQLSVRLVGRTVNALYYATSADSAALDPAETIAAIAIAILAATAAGWWPARQAAATPPAQLLNRHAPTTPPSPATRTPTLAIALTLIALGTLATSLPPIRFANGARFPAAGYASALLWILGASLLSAQALIATARTLAPLSHLSPIARLGLAPLSQPSGRHALATAGLVAAIAMTAGMILLVGSFDHTMNGWIQRTFQADLYISSAGAQSASTDNRIAPETWQTITQHPAVADANVLHALEIHLPQGTTILAAGDLAFLRRQTDMAWIQPPLNPTAALAPDPEPDPHPNAAHPGSPTKPATALVSESFSERFGLHRGDQLVLPTPSGPMPTLIAGVFADYGNERGSILIDRSRFTRRFGSHHAASLILALHNPALADNLRAEWLTQFPGLQILTNRHLRTEVLRIFRQTFAITHALEAIGLAVAVLGLALSLASLLFERRNDWTTLRALGMRPIELAATAAVEGLAIAAAALTLGLATAFALGWLLIHVINKQTFGWTLQSAIPIPQLLTLASLVLLATAAVSFAVGRWGARLPADREE